MLSLKIADKNVDLPDDFSFTMNLKSPIFGEVGSYSYPFKIPVTPRNARILDFVHRIESTADVYRSDQGAFSWNGLTLFQGAVRLKSLNPKTYEGSIFEGEGDFYYQRKNMSLQQIDFGTRTFADETDKFDFINGCSLNYYPSRDVAFPRIYNLKYFDPPTTDAGQMWINNYINGYIGMLTPSSNPTIIIPMLYLRYVLSVIFAKLSYTLDNSFFSAHPEFNLCAIYNSVTCWETANGYFQYPFNKILYNYHVPQMNLNDFLTGLETFFNIRFFLDNKNRRVKILSLDDIIKSPVCSENITKIISKSIEIEEKILGFKLEMELDSGDTETENISTYDETQFGFIRDTVPTLNDLPCWPGSAELDIRYVVETKSFYRMISGSWVLFDLVNFITYTKYLYKMAEGESLSTAVSPLFETGQAEAEVGCQRENWREVPCRLFFLTPVYDAGSFYAMRANSYTTGMSLFYNGADGLFNKQFKAFLDFRMSAKLVRITAQLSYRELQNFDFSQKYMIGGIRYLVKSLQVTIKKDRIMPSLLECYNCS
jgi:hypothetical protein